MRISTISLATLMAFLAFSGVLLAQVASPRIDPVTPSFIINPATVVWSDSSRAGGAYGTVDVQAEIPGFVSGTLADGNLTFAQGRWVQDQYAVAGSWMEMDLDSDIMGGSFTIGGTTIEGAYKIGEMFSVGVALETDESSSPFETDETSLISVGGVVNLQQAIFIGGTYGTETTTETPAGGSSNSASQSVLRVGGAYRQQGGDMDFRAELYLETKGGNDDATVPLDEEQTTGISGEVLTQDILVGLEYVTGDSTPPSGGTGTEETEITLTGGWVPPEGLAVVAMYSTSEETEGSEVIEFTLIAVGAAWRF